MDTVKLTHYRVAAEKGFWKHKQTDFQEWLGAIMTWRYCDDFIRIRLSKGDGGRDGYRLSTQSGYHYFLLREHRCVDGE